MDYAECMRQAAIEPHAQFHSFMLAVPKCDHNDQFLFFEGDDDPLFYVDKLQVYLNGRGYHEFICDGRDGVLKIHELIARDKRNLERSHFFIDKDHSDIFASKSTTFVSLFQTECYSFENYLVSDQVIRRFWVERLHLPSTDDRLQETVHIFRRMHQSFMSRMRVLMAVVLIGRGISGGSGVKLNLNNVALDKVVRLDFENLRVGWRPNALERFLEASNFKDSNGVDISCRAIADICKRFLPSDAPKFYVRGKYELWFFVKFLIFVTRELSDRKKAALNGVPRAKPKESVSSANCVIQLASLSPCPDELKQFFRDRFGTPSL